MIRSRHCAPVHPETRNHDPLGEKWYRLKISYLFMSLLLSNLCFPDFSLKAQAGLVINEFMADNDNVVVDSSDGKYDDWLEIYNPGPNDVNLKNYYLTDNRDLPQPWSFPAISILAGKFLVIWADGDPSAVGLHTNFKLSKSGEFLGLYTISGQDTMAVDTLTFGPQTTNVSWGRYPDGSSYWQKFTIPTPNAPNSTTPNVDASAIIFDDTQIHNYELHFYITNWADSLKYYYEHGEVYMPAQLKYAGLTLDSIGVRYKGNSSYLMSRNTPKKPFKFKFNKYKKDQILYNIKELNFSNCVKDPSFMREKIGYDIIRKYLPAPRAAYANIYVDGNLIGFYVQVEQVDKTFLARYYENDAGNLYKASDQGTNLAYLGSDPSAYTTCLELKTNEDENDWSGLITLLAKINQTPTRVFTDTLENYLNLDGCCRFLAFNMLLSNFDSYTGSGRNFYLYDDSFSSQFHILPWDLNEAFGAYTNNWNIFTLDILKVPNLDQRPLNQKILQHETLKNNYLNIIQAMLNGPAAYDSVAAQADKLKLLINGYVQADHNKLYSYQNFLNNIEKDVNIDLGIKVPGIKSFSKARNENIRTQLAKYMTTAVPVENPVCESFTLNQNYPNPFNATTHIRFSLAEVSDVELKIYNIRGELVTVLFKGKLTAGVHHFSWQALNLSSGVYYGALKHAAGLKMIKMVLLK
ncbi:CotH kinase family protein [candidate division KSB1 bacterium]|nr:CotH kinase family protein [candidate division KSB1 bacterium]